MFDKEKISEFFPGAEDLYDSAHANLDFTRK